LFGLAPGRRLADLPDSPAMPARFVHLHLHSEFSLVDSTIRLSPLIKRCVALGLPAVAVTDLSNFFGLVKFYKEAQKSGVKPIAGSDVIVQLPGGAPSRLTLLRGQTSRDKLFQIEAPVGSR
jgi:DNA polymerase III alpha subunit